MISIALAFMLPIPSDLANLRVESAQGAFRQCLKMRASEMQQAPDAARYLTPSTIADIARQSCYVLEGDVRNVLPAVVENMLRKEGIKVSDQALVDQLADKTLKLMVDEDMAALMASLGDNKPGN